MSVPTIMYAVPVPRRAGQKRRGVGEGASIVSASSAIATRPGQASGGWRGPLSRAVADQWTASATDGGVEAELPGEGVPAAGTEETVDEELLGLLECSDRVRRLCPVPPVLGPGVEAERREQVLQVTDV